MNNIRTPRPPITRRRWLQPLPVCSCIALTTFAIMVVSGPFHLTMVSGYSLIIFIVNGVVLATIILRQSRNVR
jgi:hypothetical protein